MPEKGLKVKFWRCLFLTNFLQNFYFINLLNLRKLNNVSLKGVRIMKKTFIVSALALGILAMNSGMAFAAPYNAADNNPQVVAFYPTGTHGIPSEPCANHVGEDLVMRAGNSGNFQQWSYGSTPSMKMGRYTAIMIFGNCLKMGRAQLTRRLFINRI